MPIRGHGLTEIEGLVGAVVVDLDSGSVKGVADRGSIEELELAALLDGDVLRRAHEIVGQIAPEDHLASIVMTIDGHHHVILPSRRALHRFLYLVVERGDAALGLLLHRLDEAHPG
jgi:hypothetical protein